MDVHPTTAANPWAGGPDTTDRRAWIFAHARYRQLLAWLLAHRLARPTIVAIKLLHTAIFLGMLTCVLHLTTAGIRNRATPWTVRALVVVAAEGGILGISGRRCPLTVVVEDLGAAHGAVSDLFLPPWIAQRIIPLSSTLLSIGAIALLCHRAAAVHPVRLGGQGPAQVTAATNYETLVTNPA